MFKQNLQNGMGAIDALKLARDTAAKYVVYACQFANTIKFYSSCAAQMLYYDRTKNSGKYQNVLSQVFANRNIPISSLKLLSNIDYNEIKNKSEYAIQEMTDHGFVWTTKTVKTLNFTNGLSALSGNVESFSVEIPCTKIYILDKDKNLIHATETTEKETTEMVTLCVNKLQSKNLIGAEENQLFEIKNGKLIRKRIMCRCHPNNACNPQSPEYGKPWRGENNAGCGSKGITVDCECNSPEPTPAPKLGCYINTKSCSNTSRVFCQNINRKVC
jgi:hypothetical protein